ncbi:MAG: hypothetical protein HY532_06860 [Chloroflexi bacterium]|nr:hypothetical protein [Chloroflexota bacterium]
MRRYLETLFRARELLLVPILVVPIIALMFMFLAGRQHQSDALIWVQPSPLHDPFSESRTRPSDLEAQTLRGWLLTESFRLQVLERVGLLQLIEEGAWPVPSPLERQLNALGVTRIPGVRDMLRTAGLLIPQTTVARRDRAMNMVKDSVTVAPEGDYLVQLKYVGNSPQLGTRLLEEVIILYREITVAERAAPSSRSQNIQVVDPPQVVRDAGFTKRAIAMTVLFGIGVGGIIGIVPIILLTWLDKTVRTREELQELLDTPLIAHLSVAPKIKGRAARNLRSAIAYDQGALL